MTRQMDEKETGRGWSSHSADAATSPSVRGEARGARNGRGGTASEDVRNGGEGVGARGDGLRRSNTIPPAKWRRAYRPHRCNARLEDFCQVCKYSADNSSQLYHNHKDDKTSLAVVIVITYHLDVCQHRLY